jgi:hypothetical protein
MWASLTQGGEAGPFRVDVHLGSRFLMLLEKA